MINDRDRGGGHIDAVIVNMEIGSTTKGTEASTIQPNPRIEIIRQVLTDTSPHL